MLQCVIDNRKEVYVLTQEELKQKIHYDPETGVFRWRFAPRPGTKPWEKAGSPNGGGYMQIKIQGKTYQAHRLAWLYIHGVFPDKGLDHIDRNPLNNSIGNLRKANQAENGQNRNKQKNNTSGFVGVSYYKQSQKWRAQIAVKGKDTRLGLFDTPEEAHAAYVAAKAKYHSFQPTLK
jgi:hypothetical protein